MKGSLLHAYLGSFSLRRKRGVRRCDAVILNLSSFRLWGARPLQRAAATARKAVMWVGVLLDYRSVSRCFWHIFWLVPLTFSSLAFILACIVACWFHMLLKKMWRCIEHFIWDALWYMLRPIAWSYLHHPSFRWTYPLHKAWPLTCASRLFEKYNGFASGSSLVMIFELRTHLFAHRIAFFPSIYFHVLFCHTYPAIFFVARKICDLLAGMMFFWRSFLAYNQMFYCSLSKSSRQSCCAHYPEHFSGIFMYSLWQSNRTEGHLFYSTLYVFFLTLGLFLTMKSLFSKLVFGGSFFGPCKVFFSTLQCFCSYLGGSFWSFFDLG